MKTLKQKKTLSKLFLFVRKEIQFNRDSSKKKEFYSNIFQNFFRKNNIKISSRNTDLGAKFVESFNRTNRILLKRPVFERRDASWIDNLSTVTKQYNNRIHPSTK